MNHKNYNNKSPSKEQSELEQVGFKGSHTCVSIIINLLHANACDCLTQYIHCGIEISTLLGLIDGLTPVVCVCVCVCRGIARILEKRGQKCKVIERFEIFEPEAMPTC